MQRFTDPMHYKKLINILNTYVEANGKMQRIKQAKYSWKLRASLENLWVCQSWLKLEKES